MARRKLSSKNSIKKIKHVKDMTDGMFLPNIRNIWIKNATNATKL